MIFPANLVRHALTSLIVYLYLSSFRLEILTPKDVTIITCFSSQFQNDNGDTVTRNMNTENRFRLDWLLSSLLSSVPLQDSMR